MDVQIQRRYGTRVRAQIPVRITSLDPATSFSENCHTMLVNPHGCGIRCAHPLKPGLRVRVEGLPGGSTAIASVASNIPPAKGAKFWVVGIGLEAPGNLWCMAPVPPDWGSYAACPEFFPSGAYVTDYSAPGMQAPQK